MPLSRLVVTLSLASILCLATSCSVEQPGNRYQVSGSERLETPPVTELQQQALAALDSGQYQLAIDTLQRAIRIQPRNPWNWYYLGQTYWQSGDLARCSAMVERAVSYGDGDDRLDRASDRLRQRCAGG